MTTIGMVYSAELRNNGTPVLCFDAIKRGLAWGEQVRRYTPFGVLPQHDFYLYIDDGRDGLKWECPHPNAYWAIDAHLGYDYRLEKARGFDWVFCAQKEAAGRMLQDGIKNVGWLPLACHPAAHPNLPELMRHEEVARLAPQGLDKKWDWAFVGFINAATGEGFHNRLEYLDVLHTALPNAWITTGVFFEEMAVRFVQARLGFNVSIRNDLNMRFFEVLSTGTALLTNRDVDGWGDIGFEDGRDFIGFEGPEEMVERAKWMVAHPMEREAIARAGHERVRMEHTYVHRMQYVLDACGVKRGEGE